MNYQEIARMIASAGFPCVYHHWEDNSAPPLPYVVYLFPGRDDFYADNSNYQEITELDMELYSDAKDFTAEQKFEQVLRDNGITFDKTEAYISSEKMYEVLYETEIVLDGE
ncbi:MAG: hypothetical protein K2K06_10830 [Oscillospiraceae bacterium]|nr:hypothetical protein [Oscillospiraceae bacterium]MDE6708515.1 hypothetical protein [Oscillospiraceae bacterium]